ncbi:MAG: hypothetical protein ABF979_14795 [Gluconobacter sp.]|uniref:hypothetical protein n=1 Tax=Gluconobacter sp. TaxID=1876758 RepID=UPI0039E9D857
MRSSILPHVSLFGCLMMMPLRTWQKSGLTWKLVVVSSAHYDLMIADRARSRGLVVVTGNLQEFTRVNGLRSEDWMAD